MDQRLRESRQIKNREGDIIYMAGCEKENFLDCRNSDKVKNKFTQNQAYEKHNPKKQFKAYTNDKLQTFKQE